MQYVFKHEYPQNHSTLLDIIEGLEDDDGDFDEEFVDKLINKINTCKNYNYSAHKCLKEKIVFIKTIQIHRCM